MAMENISARLAMTGLQQADRSQRDGGDQEAPKRSTAERL
jgi:hypothetical protein